RARGEHADLWRHAVAQDRPFAVCDVVAQNDPALRELLVARAFWGARGAPVDLVVVCGDPAALDPASRRAVAEAGRTPGGGLRRRGGAARDGGGLEVLVAPARLVVRGAMPTAETLREEPAPAASARFAPVDARAGGATSLRAEPLRAANGLGGFSRDGLEYV